MKNIENNVNEMEQEMTEQEILMNEDELIRGLLEAADYQQENALQKKIQIKRNNKVLFEFRIHPLSEEDVQTMRKRCTKYMPNPNGRHLPKIEVETNWVRMRSMKIYEATVAEDQEKLWNNKAVMQKLKVLDPVEVVELVLMAGEKDAVIDQIDNISGYGVNLENYAEN